VQTGLVPRFPFLARQHQHRVARRFGSVHPQAGEADQPVGLAVEPGDIAAQRPESGLVTPGR
jgi:hypothetical protein